MCGWRSADIATTNTKQTATHIKAVANVTAMAAINANSISWQCQWPYYASGFHKGTKPIHSHKVVHEKNTCNVISTVTTVACCGWYKFAAREILYLQRKSFCLLFIIPFFISPFSLGHSRAAATRIQLHHRTIAVVVLLYQTKKK